jgi:hypothetical protein
MSGPSGLLRGAHRSPVDYGRIRDADMVFSPSLS